MRKRDLNYEAARILLRQWQAIAEDYYGDYYPLTQYHVEDDVWMAWQFDRPERGRGFVMAFRRGASPYPSADFTLHGLESGARYEIRNVDEAVSHEFSGSELLGKGLTVNLSARPGSALITYRKLAK